MSSRPDRYLPRGRSWGVLSTALRLYLMLALSGCAATRPNPTPEEARAMEVRTFEAGYDETFSAVTNALQDMSYTLDPIDRDCGLIVAHRASRVALAEISTDDPPATGEGTPTWAKVALVVTGVALVVGLVAILSADDDDDRDGADEDATYGDLADNRARDCRDRHHRHDHDTGHVETVIVHDDSDSGPPIYSFEITVRLTPMGPSRTNLRVSGQGTCRRDGTMEQAGPIHDPAFYSMFHARVQEALSGQTEADWRKPDRSERSAIWW